MYAIYQGVDAYFSLHTNCCDSSGTSMWTWYPEMWVGESSWPAGFIEDELPPGTYEWSDAIHREVISSIRTLWQSDWPDMGHFGANFGDNSRRFVAHNDGWLSSAAGAIHAVEVAATDTAGFDLNQYLILANLWFRHISLLLQACPHESGVRAWSLLHAVFAPVTSPLRAVVDLLGNRRAQFLGVHYPRTDVVARLRAGSVVLAGAVALHRSGRSLARSTLAHATQSRYV
jgi:hypothetical protein